jgi:L-alanine-DL-glutamate epimerase-like enolase superfamily enzyme
MSDTISEIAVAPIPARHWTELGRNAYTPEGLGETRTEWLVRARTTGGVEGLSNARHTVAADGGSVARLIAELREVFLGRPVRSLLEIANGRAVAPGAEVRQALMSWGWMDILAVDLVARTRGESVASLLGERKRDRISAYESTTYFQDLLHPQRGLAQVVAHARRGFADGFRQFKVKVGRGGRAMTPRAGLHRDIDVVLAIRDTLGPDVKLMVDANFGYDNQPEKLAEFIRATSPAGLTWLEEMVTASTETYQTLRDLQATYCPETLLVAGEVDSNPPSGAFVDLLDQRLIDGYQPDIVRIGHLRWKQLETRLAENSILPIPHNFGNGRFGLIAGLALATSLDTWVALEDERIRPNVYADDKLHLVNGAYQAPTGPGLGVEIDDETYARIGAPNEVVIRA